MNASFKDRLRYKFDAIMSRGTVALIGWLALITFTMIIIASLVIFYIGLAPDKRIPDLLWMSLMRAMDAGTIGGDDGSWQYLLVMFIVTLGGIFILSTLIGLLTNGISAKIEELRKGKSCVIEKGHTIIINWSDQVFKVLSELAEANKSKRHSAVVVFSEKDKVEMEDEIRSRLEFPKGMKVICRTGSPVDMQDLAVTGLNTSKSIIILPPETNDPDVDVVKTILAITNNPTRRKEPYHIVSGLMNEKNYHIAKMVGKNEVELVLVSDIAARLVAQTCRQSGLSIVYTELLDFGGAEIYFHHEKSLEGKTYGEILHLYNDSAIIGLVDADGTTKVNPPANTVLGKGEKIIVIAEDDDKIRLSGKKSISIDRSVFSDEKEIKEGPEKLLMLGWNNKGAAILREMNSYVAKGTTATILCEVESAAEEVEELKKKLPNIQITFILGDSTDRVSLDNVGIKDFEHIIILGYSDTFPPEQVDSKTLFTLLHIRDIAEALGKRFSIVSEMLDEKNRSLAEVTKADDFVIGNKIIGLLLTQISENKSLNAVFQDIFDSDGSEVYLKPVSLYVKPGVPVDFHAVVESASRKNETAIGYRIISQRDDQKKAYGVVVNPNKDTKIAFTKDDKIVVFSES